MRNSLHKNKILSILKKDHLLTISEIHKKIPEVDYSTVFRNIEQLLEEGAIKKVLINKKITGYEKLDDNHYHFVCNKCGKVEPIREKITNSKFKDKEITDIIVRGNCHSCKK
jgi:Fe2+ or Zn2+ uptake regulation protein